MQNDVAYLSSRALEERIAAMKSAHPNARRAHQLAKLYDERLSALTLLQQCLDRPSDDRSLEPLSA